MHFTTLLHDLVDSRWCSTTANNFIYNCWFYSGINVKGQRKWGKSGYTSKTAPIGIPSPASHSAVLHRLASAIGKIPVIGSLSLSCVCKTSC